MSSRALIFGDRFIHQTNGPGIDINPNETCSRIQTDKPSQNDLKLITASARIETLIATGEIFQQLQDFCNNYIFISIGVEDLFHFSQVSKSCYFATKANHVWVCQFKKFFPSILYMPMDKTCYSPEQQFKIYYNHFQCTLNSHKKTFNQNKIILSRLLGPNGDMAIARKEYEDCGGRDAHTRFIKALFSCESDEKNSMIKLWRSPDAKAYEALEKLQKLTQQVRFLNSRQKRLPEQINEIPSAFDNQERFENCIKKSGNVSKNLSQ